MFETLGRFHHGDGMVDQNLGTYSVGFYGNFGWGFGHQEILYGKLFESYPILVLRYGRVGNCKLILVRSTVAEFHVA